MKSLGKQFLAALSVACACLHSAAPASADLITGGNGQDGPPRNGSFTTTSTTPTVLSVGSDRAPNPNFDIERRFALEFDFSGVSSGATIQSAQLFVDFLSATFDPGTSDNVQEITFSLFGYQGNGSLEAQDFENSQLLPLSGPAYTFTYNQSSQPGDDINVDVTEFVSDQFEAGSDFVGFTFGFTDSQYTSLSQGEGTANFSGFSGSGTAPTLTIQSAAVPEPSSLGILGCGFAGCYAVRRFRRRKNAS